MLLHYHHCFIKVFKRWQEKLLKNCGYVLRTSLSQNVGLEATDQTLEWGVHNLIDLDSRLPSEVRPAKSGHSSSLCGTRTSIIVTTIHLSWTAGYWYGHDRCVAHGWGRLLVPEHCPQVPFVVYWGTRGRRDLYLMHASNASAWGTGKIKKEVVELSKHWCSSECRGWGCTGCVAAVLVAVLTEIFCDAIFWGCVT